MLFLSQTNENTKEVKHTCRFSSGGFWVFIKCKPFMILKMIRTKQTKPGQGEGKNPKLSVYFSQVIVIDVSYICTMGVTSSLFNLLDRFPSATYIYSYRYIYTC